MIKINEKYASQVVTTKTGKAKVADHTPEQLVELALMAVASRNQILLRCFSEVPTLEELKGMSVQMQMAALKEETTQEPIAEEVDETEVPTKEEEPKATLDEEEE